MEPSLNWPRTKKQGWPTWVVPVEAEAHHLPFASGYFDGVISVDAYHDFGTEVR